MDPAAAAMQLRSQQQSNKLAATLGCCNTAQLAPRSGTPLLVALGSGLGVRQGVPPHQCQQANNSTKGVVQSVRRPCPKWPAAMLAMLGQGAAVVGTTWAAPTTPERAAATAAVVQAVQGTHPTVNTQVPVPAGEAVQATKLRGAHVEGRWAAQTNKSADERGHRHTEGRSGKMPQRILPIWHAAMGRARCLPVLSSA
jgi:hypothetical protein